MKIYTRTGDLGQTGLFGGQRVSKSDGRVEAYGAVDETNSLLGWAETLLRDLPLQAVIREIQSDLLAVGADLATPPETTTSRQVPRLAEDRVARLEHLIDGWEGELQPLTRFIIPGGSPGAAALHVCRTTCRRAEREIVRLAETEEVNPRVVAYMNRLSDLLFVLARWVNARLGIEEPTWDAGRG